MRSIPDADAFASRCQRSSFEFPSTARDARHAARTWFEAAPNISPAKYRDQKFVEHCKDKADSPTKRHLRRVKFKQAFAEAMGHIVVEEARLYAHPA